MTDLDPNLDPYTLRAIARRYEERGHKWRTACPCTVHTALANVSDEFASDLLTLAIQVEVARAGVFGPTGADHD